MSAQGDTLRAEAARHDQDARDSFERCDTDGFVSQWASGCMAQKNRLAAQIADRGGKWDFPALADLDGNLVPAKMINTRYGTKWGVFATAEDANGNGNIIEWVAFAPARASTLTKKGYQQGWVEADGYADLRGANACNVGAVAIRSGDQYDPTLTFYPEIEED